MKKYLLAFVLSLIVMVGLVPCALADTVYVSTQAELETAIANAPVNTPTTIVLADGAYTMPQTSSKEFVFTGSKSAVMNCSALGLADCSLTFDGITVKFPADANYQGLQHTKKVVYRNCTITGQQTMYAPVVEFTNCIFENKAAYCVWTYGATDVTFTGCTFNTGGKAILVYTEGETHAQITLTKCVFYSDGTLATDKAAVEVGSSPYSSATTYNIILNDCSAFGFSPNNSTSPLWGNKNNMDVSHLGIQAFTRGAEGNGSVPKTGDSSQPMLYLALLLMGLAGMSLLRKKRANA